MKSLRLVALLSAACALAAGPALAGATTNLGIAYPTPGADDSAWGAILNSALQSFDNEWKVETLGDGNLAASSATRIVRLTTVFTAARTITLPPATSHAANQPIIVIDPVGAVGGSNSLTFTRAGSDTIESPGAAAGTSYVVSAPRRAVVLRSDGASKWIVSSDQGTMARQDAASVAITGGSITGVTDLAVADGGTGASSASAARSNLGAAASGANGDITSLSGVTTPLTVAQGGTGSATASGARTNLGVTATGGDVNYAWRSNNLSDLGNPATARTNLGLGTSASPAFTGLTTTGNTSLGDGNTDTTTISGHLAVSGSTPTLSSCGTSPSIDPGANDHRGFITNGSGTVGVCTVTFSRAFANAPFCTLTTNSNNPVVLIAVNGPPATTGFTASFGSNYGGGGWFYICLD